MVLFMVVLFALVAAALFSVVTSSMLRAAIGLALVSALLAVVLFLLGAHLAALFELSIGAGLIPVLFVSVVSLTRREQQEELPAIRRLHGRRFWPLVLVLLAVGTLLLLFPPTLPPPLPLERAAASAGSGQASARASLWVGRRVDIVGQALILLAGAIGIAVLFKERQP